MPKIGWLHYLLPDHHQSSSIFMPIFFSLTLKMTNFPIAILLLLSSFAVNTVLTAPSPPPHIVPPQVTANSDNYCDSVPAHVRHGCKMVAQIWAEARKVPFCWMELIENFFINLFTGFRFLPHFFF